LRGSWDSFIDRVVLQASCGNLLSRPYVSLLLVGRDSSGGIATRYEVDGLAIESRLGRDFLHPPGPALGPTHSPVQWVPALFPGGKAAEAWS
jgi:hypothetical protein